MAGWVNLLYLACLGLSAAEYVLLRNATRKAGWLRQIVGPNFDQKERKPLQGLPIGAPVPRFEMRVTRSTNIFRSRDLRGAPSLLLFLPPRSTSSADDQSSLLFFANVMSDRLDGKIYVVCPGGPGGCDEVDELFNGGRSNDKARRVMILEDPHGFVAHACGVQRTPTAIRVDDRGRIEQYGFPADLVVQEVPALAEHLGTNGASA